MTKHKIESNESELDRVLMAAEGSAVGQRLKAAGQEIQPRPEFIQKLEGRLRQAAQAQPHIHKPRFTWGFKSLALVGFSLGLLLVVGTLIWLNQATPVNAQQVLQQAAAPRMAPNQIVHHFYELKQTNGKPTTGTADVWVQADANGVIIRTAMTFTGLNADGTVLYIEHVLIAGDNARQYDYDPHDNTATVRAGTFDEVMGDQPNFFDGASVARYLSKIDQGDVKGVHLLPPQTFDGVPVQAVNTKGDGGSNYYFDAHSYILRGMEGPGVRVWLVQDETVSAKDIPSDAFAFNPPPNVRVIQENPKSKNQDGARVEMQTLLDVCHLEQATLDAGQASGKTPLAICQTRRPEMTQAELVAGLLVPIKAQWDAVVAAGKLTAAQEAEYLTNAQKKLGFWVTSPLNP